MAKKLSVFGGLIFNSDNRKIVLCYCNKVFVGTDKKWHDNCHNNTNNKAFKPFLNWP